MRHVHPFPARMAPEIALKEIEGLKSNQLVLDPMSGSGMVLAQASRLGVPSIGIDLDPLARLISSVGATAISPKSVDKALQSLVSRCRQDLEAEQFRELPWIDHDEATKKFVEFWFYEKQRQQLRCLAYHLTVEPVTTVRSTKNVLVAAISRLIVTKEPKASLARDTAHSRPHRTIRENEFDVIEALEKSVRHILSTIERSELQVSARTYLGDARKLTRITDSSVDCVVTSPPYLNAIDYMRGHKLSLVWWGYSVSDLTQIRAKAIGCEKGLEAADDSFDQLVDEHQLLELPSRSLNMLRRYYKDLCAQLSETFRVLKSGGTATYVIGNCNIRGCFVPNHEFLKSAALGAGLSFSGEDIREIPNSRRYLPIPTSAESSLSGRMRSEYILKFQK